MPWIHPSLRSIPRRWAGQRRVFLWPDPTRMAWLGSVWLIGSIGVWFSYEKSYSRYNSIVWVNSIYLVGGFEHEWIVFHFIYGMSSIPLTNSIIFQDGYCTTNHLCFVCTNLTGAKRREWMGCWGLLGWLLLVIMDHSRKFPAFSTSKITMMDFPVSYVKVYQRVNPIKSH